MAFYVAYGIIGAFLGAVAGFLLAVAAIGTFSVIQRGWG